MCIRDRISKALKVWCPLPQALAGILHVLLNLAFLPTRCWITELRIKQVVADHGSEPLIDPALFATPHRIHSGLHVVVDAALGNATEDLKGMPVGIKQHFMFLLVVSPKHKGPAVGQLKLGNLKFDLFARYAGKVLTPIELEGFATSKAQGDETTPVSYTHLDVYKRQLISLYPPYFYIFYLSFIFLIYNPYKITFGTFKYRLLWHQNSIESIPPTQYDS